MQCSTVSLQKGSTLNYGSVQCIALQCSAVKYNGLYLTTPLSYLVSSVLIDVFMGNHWGQYREIVLPDENLKLISGENTFHAILTNPV